MKCKLCEKSFPKLAKSHIFPKGIFAQLEDKAHMRSLGARGGRNLPSALYDRDILCHGCETKVFSPLDDYAIKILRDKDKAEKVQFKKTNAALYIYDEICLRTLRAFVASLIWRVSVSKLKELSSVKLNHSYVRRTKTDLRRPDSNFEYIDAVFCFLRHEIHSGFVMPYRKRLYPKDLRRDKIPVKGWFLGMPNLVIIASVDTKRHPLRGYYSFAPELTGKNHHWEVTTGLGDKISEYSFAILEQERSDVIEESMISIIDQEFNR